MEIGNGPLFVWGLLISSILAQSAAAHPLRHRFYYFTCPNAEHIVADVVRAAVHADAGLPAGLIRLSFHDCFVRGCDASILLDTTPTNEAIEKDSPANAGTLRGLEVIDKAKARLEDECPGRVSCADILAFAARDAAVLAGLPHYRVQSGRRDGRTSLASEVGDNLPSPYHNVTQLIDMFGKKGFSANEMVILSGAHSIGKAGCRNFEHRMLNFSADNPTDPSLDPTYAYYLKLMCTPSETLPNSSRSMPLDSITSMTLDNAYYVGVQMGRGLLQSDQALMTDSRTRKMVKYFARNPHSWANQFGKAMAKISTLDVLTDSHKGEVRTNCRFIN
ncbi:peroxidase 5-like [Magnolia sinica]|uniref:peroxidase 5-like n=1 Tax=Magnolia sinica TaxID=86752 RepID=UPI002657ECD9|nr:peroxidase 5-like [Magnolia sinica]